ncbi:MAG: prepilin peptidase [bacterium]
MAGSFLNVCISRLPEGESVVFPPSNCPLCKTKIHPVDLIPVLSYFLLRGRCRECGGLISPRYPLVEALTALSFYAVARWSPDPLATLKYLIFTSALIVIFFIDIRHLIIPDLVVLPLTEMGLLIAIFENRFWDGVLGALVGIALFLAIAEMAALMFRREGMGGGDVKFAGMIGAFLGVKMLLVASFLSFIAGGLIVIPMLLLGIRKVGEPVPFGPMMVAGSAAVVVAGNRILELYSNYWM